MILDVGSTILVSHRRMFENDECRYFLGRVLAGEGPLVKLEGFSFVRDVSNGQYVKKHEKRVKVISLASPGHIVYELLSADIESAEIRSEEGDVVLVNGAEQIMNLSERTHCGHF